MKSRLISILTLCILCAFTASASAHDHEFVHPGLTEAGKNVIDYKTTCNTEIELVQNDKITLTKAGLRTVGWFDCFNVRECSAMRIDTGVKLDFDKKTKQVKITKAVPKHQSGITAFESERKTVSDGKTMIFLREVPVFVEEE